MAINEGLELIISADVQSALKGLANLKEELKELANTGKGNLATMEKALRELENQIKQTTDPAGFLRLSKSAAELKTRIADLKSAGTSAAPALSRLGGSANAANNALTNTGRILQDLPFGIIGIANNINPLIESFQRASVSAKETGSSLGKDLLGALKGGGGLGLAFSVVTAAVQFAVLGFSSFFRTVKTGKDDVELLKIELDSIALSIDTAKKNIDLFRSNLDFRVEFFGAGKDQVDILNLRIQQQEKLVDEIKRQKKFSDEAFEELIISPLRIQGSDEERKAVEEKIKESINKAIEITRDLGKAETDLLVLRKKTQVQQTSDIEEALKKQADLYRKFQEETISRARQFAKEFGDSFVVPNLEESFFKTKEDIFRLSKKLLDDVAKRKLKIKIPAQFEFELLPETTTGVTDDTIKAFNDDLKSRQETFSLDFSLSKESVSGIDKMIERFSQFGDKGIKAYAAAASGARNFNEVLKGLEQNEKTQLVLANAIGDSFSAVFDSVIAGTDALDGFFKGLGRALENLIRKLIATAAAAGILTLLSGGTFAGAKGFSAIFAKISGFAEGGIVSAPTLGLIGEGAGTRNSNPEIVAPLNKLKDILGDSGGSQRVSGTLKASGSELIAVIESTERRQGRSF